jgi:hypothetical protein
MSPRRFPAALVLFLFPVLVVPLVGPARACAPAPRRNQSVAIASESAIILWDAASKTQHFIRRASFTTEARDFGFLVPTPTKPTLAEASDEAFAVLARITAPKVVTRTRSSGGGCGCGRQYEGSANRSEPKAGAVRVLEEKRVAGHDAAVLEADDEKALGKWLKDHGYYFSPALTEWVAPYVKAGWKVTAFKIAKDAPRTRAVATSAVRMTFKADRPFFPYREPESPTSADKEPKPVRLLRVFFLSESRVKGTLGPKGDSWPGQVAWANRLEAADREKLLQLLKLPAKTPPASWWLTEYEDQSSPRPGAVDIYFSPSEDQGTVARPDEIQYVSGALPGCVMCYALVGYLLAPCLVRHWRRRRGHRG